MPRKFIKRYLPEPHHVRRHRTLRRVFGDLLHEPNLWHLNRRSAAGAMAVGLFCAFVPLPGQMVLAAALAIFCRVNLPMSVALVWITNPLTIPPIFYTTYRIGAWILGQDDQAPAFEASLQWLKDEFDHIWAPLFLGSALVGVAAAVLGYVLIRGIWRWHVLREWERRRLKHRRHARRPRSRGGGSAVARDSTVIGAATRPIGGRPAQPGSARRHNTPSTSS